MISFCQILAKRVLALDDVAMIWIERGGIPTPKPLIIHYNPAPQTQKPLVIQGPAPPAYQNSKVVPWEYKGQTMAGDITSIAGVGGDLWKRSPVEEKKKERSLTL
ncbi:hypothetical protein CR513_49551, partial [Mucuna pruriens]